MSQRTDEAQAKLHATSEQVQTWERRVEQLSADVRSAEENAGADALATGDLEGAAANVRSLQGQLSIARQTVVAAEVQRDVAQADVWHAEAQDLRDEADADELAVSLHLGKTQELLEQLREHEGGPYVPDLPSSDPSAVSDRPFWTPRSLAMTQAVGTKRRQALALDAQANELIQRSATRPLT